MSTTRPYRMAARQEAVQATRARILAAVRDLAYEQLDFDPTLERVASRAGVSVQTVLRHFVSRQALLEQARETARSEIVEERRPAAGGADAALRALLQHYELRGAFTLAMLAREDDDPGVALITSAGKVVHRRWVAEVFADALPPEGASRDALLDLLVVATDVYAWKLLRRDRRLPVAAVHARMRAMTDALLAGSRAPSRKKDGS
ncbi:TetR family transcriptional regulator [Amnibacterium sp. CER49]|uniref:TetR/AcrR family transcriptional regulator n=1 Tax=Amnibacterium sp. CER49 TaxID=3039161 RepID=UPI00244D128E|nr:TetR/AcrR family transcriptional regulator [Amnibacterium sp. CER49]MDH2444999.1 TetR family transcriptional regulator [Amnibacterium sp. CER49]